MRILNIMSSLNCGGVETMITNYYNNFPKNDVIFDFIVHEKEIGLLEPLLEEKGSQIYHVTPKKNNIIRNVSELFKIIDKNKYDAIYCHQNYISCIPLFIAKIKKIKTRIIHSHGNKPTKHLLKKIIYFIERFLIKKFATNFFACGLESAKWLYGKKWNVNYPKNVIVNNAIEIQKFAFNEKTRIKMRKKYNIGNKICIFHAGRFSYEKNHRFLIDTFSKLPTDRYCLFLAGEGELLNDIVEYCNKLELNNVYFLGNRKDIDKYYLMADLFLLPSIHEGFPVTMVEAQASSLKCIASTNVSEQTKLLNKTTFLNLSDQKEWINEIQNTDIDERKTEDMILRKKGFDIKIEALKFYKLLKKICK